MTYVVKLRYFTPLLNCCWDQVEEHAKSQAETVDEGSRTMSKANEAISDSSGKISGFVDVISDIADQTNRQILKISPTFVSFSGECFV